MCDCVRKATLERQRLSHFRQLQMPLGLTLTLSEHQAKAWDEAVAGARAFAQGLFDAQPRKFYPGYWRDASREAYDRQWHERRIALGLPGLPEFVLEDAR